MAVRTGTASKTRKELPGQLALLETEGPTPGERIRDVSHGFRLTFGGLSRSKTVKEAVQKEIADEYDADADALRTVKRLIPSSHPAVKALSLAQGKVKQFFFSQTLPFPEKGVRLFCARSADEAERLTEVEQFLDEIQLLIGDYYTAANELDDQWKSVLRQAQKEQGKLFDDEDYPSSVKDVLQAKIYPFNVDIPAYYAKMSTRHYHEARELMLSRFEEAARMQEVVVAKAMAEAVDQMVKSVTSYHGGEQKMFKSSVVENVMEAMKDFNERTRAYGIGGPQMEKAFDELYKVLTTDSQGRSMRPQDVAEELRRNEGLARQITASISTMGARIAELASVAPRRALARR